MDRDSSELLARVGIFCLLAPLWVILLWLGGCGFAWQPLVIAVAVYLVFSFAVWATRE